MLELIVLGIILAGVVAIARAPLPRRADAPPAPPATDWRRFHRPTYLRRGIVPGDSTEPAADRDSGRHPPC
jgi:hypothetical protein